MLRVWVWGVVLCSEVWSDVGALRIQIQCGVYSGRCSMEVWGGAVGVRYGCIVRYRCDMVQCGEIWVHCGVQVWYGALWVQMCYGV